MSGLTVETDPEKIAEAIAKINQSPMLSKGNEERTGGLASENMTVWDEFAKAALQGLLSNPGGIIQANPMSGTGWVNCHDTGEVEVSRWASGIADAMMVERNKRGN